MNETTVGIGDMGLYVPTPRITMTRLLEFRSRTHPKMLRLLEAAVKKTGQLAFRFPEPWEDTASMAGNAAVPVLERLPESQLGKFRFISVGTETSIDYAKPVASYLQGLLQKAGYPLENKLTTYEMKHACAGGTTAMLANAAMLSFSDDPHERALTVCSDMARYDAPSTAEITQGAGAVALIIEKNPRLLEIDLRRQGLYASDVDDFFRPLDSTTARVKGSYSMECYQAALEQAFADYARRSGGDKSRIIDSIDYIALHVPFAKMPETAVRKLLKNVCGKDDAEVGTFLRRTGFLDAMYLNQETGNLYTASLYTYLAALLHREHRKHGDGIVGKKVLIASYGSGNTMLVFMGTIAPGAPNLIAQWNFDEILGGGREAAFPEYNAWLSRPACLDEWSELLKSAEPEANRFYLRGFSKTGLRIYDRAST